MGSTGLLQPTPPPTLSQLQRKFTRMVGQFIDWVYQQPGFELTVGEAYRTPEQAAIDAQKGSGIAHSLHTDRLAIDFNLFLHGVYQQGTAAYLPLGQKWEAMGGAWGGRFTRQDGNHFSLEYQGRK